MRTLLLLALSALLLSTARAQRGAPPDKPQTVRGQKAVDAFEQAIAPYVAKARASYPAAKKRYLRGLPPNYTFTVWIRLCESRESCEYLYVLVDAIKNGKINGRVNNKPIGLKTFRLGDPIQFSESRVMNWVVLRPDGSEEANELGKLIDRWKPPKA